MRSISLMFVTAVVAFLSACIYGDSAAPLALERRILGDAAPEFARELQTGAAVSILPHRRDGEVAVAGAVRVPVTIDFFLSRFRNIAVFKQGTAVLNIGKFGDPPSPRDLDRIVLGQRELDSLRNCKPGDCSLKLSAAMIRFLHGVGTTNPPITNARFRAALWSYISRYLDKGTAGMVEYDDNKNNRVQASSEFRRILDQLPWLNDCAQPLVTALNDPFRVSQGQVEEFLYWSIEDFGLKPVVSVTHVFIYRTVVNGRNQAFLASKQIYADHYTDASLGITILEDQSTDPSHPMLTVMYVNRSMTDGLRGWFASLERSIVEERLEIATRKNLSALRDRLTAAYHSERSRVAP